MTERLPFHFSLSCIGERNGNPLQYSCLENSRDRGAWWAAVYGVAQSQTRLMRLSSSSSSRKQEAQGVAGERKAISPVKGHISSGSPGKQSQKGTHTHTHTEDYFKELAYTIVYLAGLKSVGQDGRG